MDLLTETPLELEQTGALGGPGAGDGTEGGIDVDPYAGAVGREVVLAEPPGAHAGDATDSSVRTPGPIAPTDGGGPGITDPT